MTKIRDHLYHLPGKFGAPGQVIEGHSHRHRLLFCHLLGHGFLLQRPVNQKTPQKSDQHGQYQMAKGP